MVREAQTPQEGCGVSREGGWRRLVAGFTRVLARGCGLDRAVLCFGLVSLAFVCAIPNANAQTALATGDPFNPNNKKASSFGKVGNMFGKVNTKLNNTLPMRLQGDQLIYDNSGNRVVARGNVEIYYNNYVLTADEVVYDQAAGTLTAVGNVTVKEPQGNVIRADRYTLTDDFRDGFVQSLSIVTKDQSHITADRAVRREGNVTEFENGRFTPCKSDGNTPPLWCVSSARIIHDQSAQTISFQDAYFEIYGQPVFWLPYFQMPDPTVKHKSGFLAPDYGHSNSLGYIVGLPYYFALSPSYDLTVTPTYFSKQGTMYKAEWRQRLANGQYNIKLNGIDQQGNALPETATLSDRERLDGWRGSVETHGLFSLSSWWKFGWDATIESDDEYRRFYKLDSVLVTDRVNQVYLTGQSDRNYFSAHLYQFGGLLLDDTNQASSSAHPIIDYNYVFADPILGGELKWNTNALSFTRDDGVTKDPITGKRVDQNINRIVTELKWRRRMTDAIGISYTPFADVRGDIYQFDNFLNPETVTAAHVGSYVPDDTTARGMFDAGVTISYPWIASTANASHIIEPIGQIVIHEESVTQRDLPDEDARSLIFDDTNLFDTSKFSGYDRTETGTRANVGVQYTFQLHDGGYARFLAGESYHLAGENVYMNPGRADDGSYVFTPTSGLETARSDYVLGAYIAPTTWFRAISQSRFDETDFGLKREDASLIAAYGPLSGQIGYSYTAADPVTNFVTSQDEIIGQAFLKLSDRWSVGGSMRYDIDDSMLLYDAYTLKYADECFVLTASYSDQFFRTATIEPDHTLMVRFELKHLGDYAVKTDALDFNLGGDQRTN